MTDPLLRRIVVPIANEADAKMTSNALRPHLGEDTEAVTVLYVIEQTDGYMDAISPEALKQASQSWFQILKEELNVGEAFETELRAGTDIVDEIVASAIEHDATAVVFKPRDPAGLFGRLVSQNVSEKLARECPCPVVSLPESAEDDLTEVSS